MQNRKTHTPPRKRLFRSPSFDDLANVGDDQSTDEPSTPVQLSNPVCPGAPVKRRAVRLSAIPSSPVCPGAPVKRRAVRCHLPTTPSSPTQAIPSSPMCPGAPVKRRRGRGPTRLF